MIFTQSNRLEPKFTCHLFPSDVDMYRLVAIETIKEKSKWAWNTLNGRHPITYCLSIFSIPIIQMMLTIAQILNDGNFYLLSKCCRIMGTTILIAHTKFELLTWPVPKLCPSRSYIPKQFQKKPKIGSKSWIDSTDCNHDVLEFSDSCTSNP